MGQDQGDARGPASVAASSPPSAGDGAGRWQEGMSEFASGLVKNLPALLRGAVRMTETEMKQDAATAGRGAALIGAGATAGLVGFAFLLLGVIELLSKRLPRWAAAGVVGLALSALAAALGLAGKERLSGASLKPERTLGVLKAGIDAVRK